MENVDIQQANVVATVTHQADLSALVYGAPDVDILELRLDNLLAETASQEAGEILNLSGFSDSLNSGPAILATARGPEEGGVGNLDASTRVELYQLVSEQANLVDIELQSFSDEQIGEWIEGWRNQKNGCLVASFHNFQTCPKLDELRVKADLAYELGADVFKTAVVVEDFEELNLLIKLVEYGQSQKRSVSAMGMGPLGKLSRLVLARAGSCLNYGFLQTENAPGQWPASELKRLVGQIF